MSRFTEVMISEDVSAVRPMTAEEERECDFYDGKYWTPEKIKRMAELGASDSARDKAS